MLFPKTFGIVFLNKSFIKLIAMRTFLLPALLALICSIAFGQTKNGNAADQTLVNNLLNNLKSDPTNPLKIDKQTLLSIANAIPEGSLKSKLLSYGANLGVDQNLSMRQIYWDVNSAFTSNSNLSSLSTFANTGKSLDLLLNNSQQLISSIKAGSANYQPGMFMSDPYFISQLQQTTGVSANTAGAMSVGVELVMAFMEEKKRKKELKQNYPTYAEMSSQMIYPEVDQRLSKSLIDAYVGRYSGATLTSLYRYDFANGASLHAEKGIMRFVYPAKNINIPLIAIENRNNGIYYDESNYNAPQIMVSSDESRVLIYSGSEIKENNCDDCLKKNCLAVINTETGTVTHDNVQSSVQNETFNRLRVFGDTILNYTYNNYEYYYNTTNWKYKRLDHKSSPKKKYKDTWARTYGLYGNRLYWNKFSDFHIGLSWSVAYEQGVPYPSSIFDVEQHGQKYTNTDAMLDVLTGVAVSKNGILYYTAANGNAGKVDLNQTAPNNPALTSQMRSAFVSAGLEKYPFTYKNTFLFESTPRTPLERMPYLTLTPDEKNLLYFVNNKMYLFDADKLEQPQSFTLTVEPHDIRFAKENGETTLILYATNEFKFPVAKKYSLTKLLAVQSEPAVPAPIQQTNATQEKTGSGSVADELKKLKALYDEGAISKEEYEKAKKKILED